MNKRETPREHLAWAGKIFIAGLVVIFLSVTPFALLGGSAQVYLTLGAIWGWPIFIGIFYQLWKALKCFLHSKAEEREDSKHPMLKEIREKYIGKIADTDNLSDNEYDVIEGGLRFTWEDEFDYYPYFFAFEVQLDKNNAITYIGRLEVERMTGEDATSSTWEEVDPDEWGYDEMESKLEELCLDL